jgi:kanamycin kinase
VTFPAEQPAVPAAVARIAAGRPVRAVWLNELGGTTFSVADGAEYVKVYPDAEAHQLVAEEARLAWAGAFWSVPTVRSSGPGWMHTAGLPGRSAVDPYWAARPVTAARAIGTGLRRLHDALPVADCPFGRPSWIPADAPQPDRLVVCHGDACAPNTLISDIGSCAGHVDLADLGVADRWSDLAVATMSLAWNYPSGGQERSDRGRYSGGQERSDRGRYSVQEDVLFEAYGVTPDRERIAYYRLRWEE